ncbi:MAG: hypothetical protein ACOX34_02105 [Bacillota bacterium]
MKLSKRRFEFLETLAYLVNQEGAPVHYIDVSKEMAVSKWTAYDMMRQLAEDGLVEASYSLTLRFARPFTSLVQSYAKGFNLVESEHMRSRDRQLTAGPDDEWSRVRDDLLNKIHMASDRETAHLLDLTKSKYNSSPLAYCAALLSLLIIEAKRKGLDLVALRGILEIGSEKGMTLPLFAGLLMGGLLVRGARKMLPDIENLIHSFSHQSKQLEQANQDMLLEFAQTIVSKGGLAQGSDNTSAL